MKGLIELSLFLELSGPNLATYYLDSREPIQAFHYIFKYSFLLF
jgi:hypothetical protein